MRGRSARPHPAARRPPGTMTFITQRGEKPRMELEQEIGELEALVSGVNQISQSTLLLKKKKEMHEVDDALDFMKGEYMARMEACDERQREFEQRQTSRKEQVIKFEKFIQENDSKRSRAEVKYKQEAKFVGLKSHELGQARGELKRAEEDHTDLIDNLRRLRKYREYLERTVEEAEDGTYEEMWDLLNRHKTLKTANFQLMDHVQKHEAQIDALRNELYTINSAHTNQQLVQNSLIHSYQRRVEELRVANKQGADEKEKEEEGKNSENRQTGQVILAIRNLYMRCVATMHSHVAVVPSNGESTHDRLHQLNLCLQLICERIIDLADIERGYDDFVREEELKRESRSAGDTLHSASREDSMTGGRRRGRTARKA